MGFILDLYENLRGTKSKVERNKPKERNYTYDAGITGDRKVDCNTCKTQKSLNKRSSETKERDER